MFIGASIDWPWLKKTLDVALIPATETMAPEALPDLDASFPVRRQVGYHPRAQDTARRRCRCGRRRPLRGSRLDPQTRCGRHALAASPTPDVKERIDGLPADMLPRVRVILPIEAVRDTLSGIYDNAGTPDELQHARLYAIAHDACLKVDIDALTARLICASRGTGTQ